MSHYLIAIILGIVEGITEFLPISSTGHLILVNQFINFDSHFTEIFDIVIQFGAILSVIVYFFRRIFPFSRNITKNEQNNIFNLWKKTILAVFPALAIGALFANFIEKHLFNSITVAISLIIVGIILIILEKNKKNKKISSINDLSYKKSLIIGLIQCLAMIPGTSRSAATIIGAKFLGASQTVAAEFSFFLAIPTIFAASAYSLLKINASLSFLQIKILIVGFVVSFLVALIVISKLMSYISKNDFKIFGYYRIILGCIVLLYFYLF